MRRACFARRRSRRSLARSRRQKRKTWLVGQGVRMAARFSDAWLDDLRSRVSIEEIVSQYVPLKQKGSRFWGLCPFHNEKTPSFSVDTQTQLFYCFGCHTGGSVIQFVMAMENLDFAEAVRFLAERVHMPLPEETRGIALSARRTKSASMRPTSQRRAFFTRRCGRRRARRRWTISTSAGSTTPTFAASAWARRPRRVGRDAQASSAGRV